MMVRCPKCGEEARFEGNPFRPFCSERCKLVDLGDWLAGSYSVPVANEEEEETPDLEETTGDS
jgi:endogenous inhibitor of DNA gyrase (YacG/DUF329 family)